MRATGVALVILFFLSFLYSSADAQAPAKARLAPAYAADGVTMIGIRFDKIHPDSIFAWIGLRDGDVVTECNGISARDNRNSAAVLQEFAQAPVLRIMLLDATGVEQFIEVEVPRD